MVQREDVAFDADGGVTLRGWLFLPDGPGPHAAISMAHGYAGVRDHGLEPFARAFTEAGFV
ncbi:alpha/beta hydrolase, partial [Streptomyces mirabilis]